MHLLRTGPSGRVVGRACGTLCRGSACVCGDVGMQTERLTAAVPQSLRRRRRERRRAATTTVALAAGANRAATPTTTTTTPRTTPRTTTIPKTKNPRRRRRRRNPGTTTTRRTSRRRTRMILMKTNLRRSRRTQLRICRRPRAGGGTPRETRTQGPRSTTSPTMTATDTLSALEKPASCFLSSATGGALEIRRLELSVSPLQ